MAKKRALHTFFRRDRPPYASQVEAADRIQAGVEAGAQVVVVQVPVAGGKTALAEAISRWAVAKTGLALGSSTTVANNNLLVKQILDDTTGYAAIHRKDNREFYTCHQGGTCADRAKRVGGHCKPRSGNAYASDACPYLRDLRAVRGAGARVLCNQHSLLGHKLQAPCMIYDESHVLVNTAQSMASTTLWRSDYQWSASLYSVGAVRDWLLSLDRDYVEGDEYLRELDAVLCGAGEGKCIQLGSEDHYNKETEFVRILPLDVSDSAGVFWPSSKTELVVLLSATTGPIDVRILGLDKKKVVYVETESPIPEENRPVIHWPVASMAFGQREASIPLIADAIAQIAGAHRGERGFIHAPYAVAYELRQELEKRLGRDRVFGHGQVGKQARFDEWLANPRSDVIFVGSGMHEGVNLVGRIANWQCLTTTPRPSLADPGMYWLAQNDPERYEWLTIRDLAQATGRVCRGPSDYGVTYILDSSAARELQSPLLPAWMPTIQTIKELRR